MSSKKSTIKTNKSKQQKPKQKPKQKRVKKLKGGDSIYDKQYIQNDANYYKIDNIEYILKKDSVLSGKTQYDDSDLLEDPISFTHIPRTYVYLLGPNVFDVRGLWKWFIKKGNWKHPLTGENITYKDKYNIRKVYNPDIKYINDQDKIIFRHRLNRDDAILLKNNLVVFLADKVIYANYPFSKIHCAYNKQSSNVFLVKLKNIIGYIHLKEEPNKPFNESERQSRITEYNKWDKFTGEDHKHRETQTQRLLNVTNYTAFEYINIEDFFLYLNYYDKSGKIIKQIDTGELINYKNISRDINNIPKFIDMLLETPFKSLDSRYLLLEHPINYDKIKLTDRKYNLLSSFSFSTNPDKSISPDSLTDTPKSYTTKILRSVASISHRFNPYSRS